MFSSVQFWYQGSQTCESAIGAELNARMMWRWGGGDCEIKDPFLVAYQNLTGRWLFIFHARPVSFRYTSHVTTMFTYQSPTRHALLAAQKRAYTYISSSICDGCDCARVDGWRTISESASGHRRADVGEVEKSIPFRWRRRTSGRGLSAATDSPVSYTHLTLPTIYSV